MNYVCTRLWCCGKCPVGVKWWRPEKYKIKDVNWWIWGLRICIFVSVCKNNGTEQENIPVPVQNQGTGIRMTGIT